MNTKTLFSQIKQSSVFQIISILTSHGYLCLIVGGYIRTWFLTGNYSEIDLSTDAPPFVVEALFKTKNTGKKYGTLTITYENQDYQITTFREESNYKNSRHPQFIQFISSYIKDAKRRDFSINALAYDSISDKILDYHNGEKHLKKRLLVCIGDTQEKLNEDTLRIFRGFRFMSEFNLEFSNNIYQFLKKNGSTFIFPNNNRVRIEWLKLLNGNNAYKTLKLMSSFNILHRIIPIDITKINETLFKKASIYQKMAMLIQIAKNQNILNILNFNKKDKRQIISYL